MATTNSDLRCQRCGGEVGPRDIFKGWCERCGQRLPASLRAKALAPPVEVGLSEEPEAVSSWGGGDVLPWVVMLLLVLAAVGLAVLALSDFFIAG